MGDRSQITVVALATNFGFLAIFLGGLVAYLITNMIAISFGKIVASYIKESYINVAGGV